MTTIFIKLLRLRLALLNGVTAIGGYCLFPAPLQAEMLVAIFFGVTLLAMGGSALNQLLERDVDAVMTRTCLRPLPQRDISPAFALMAGLVAIAAGLAMLAVTGGYFPPLLGIAALVWYLAVYTPLKRLTSMALPLGALCGAFPPLIGWSLPGGDPADYRIIILAGVLFLWQIPHFWLLQECHEEDYRRAGIRLVRMESIPSGRNALMRLWLIAFIAGAMLLPAIGIIGRPAALWYAIFPVLLALLAMMRSRRNLFFVCLNLFPLLVTLTLLLRN